jgi:DUF971 family protein
MDQIRPKAITADRKSRTLSVTWSDGHESVYSFTLLRYACPCAECKGGHENMGTAPEPEVYEMPEEDTPATRLTNIEAVGSYALTPQWEDGHSFGIYTWSYLRSICPCAECRGKRTS